MAFMVFNRIQAYTSVQITKKNLRIFCINQMASRIIERAGNKKYEKKKTKMYFYLLSMIKDW